MTLHRLQILGELALRFPPFVVRYLIFVAPVPGPIQVRVNMTQVNAEVCFVNLAPVRHFTNQVFQMLARIIQFV